MPKPKCETCPMVRIIMKMGRPIALFCRHDPQKVEVTADDWCRHHPDAPKPIYAWRRVELNGMQKAADGWEPFMVDTKLGMMILRSIVGYTNPEEEN